MPKRENDSAAVDAPLDLKADFVPVSYEDWRGLVAENLKGASFNKRLTTQTHEGINVQPLYTATDFSAADDTSGFPGQPPFIRGATALGATGKGWLRCQHYRNSSPEACNAAMRTDLQRGTNAIWIELDAAGRGSPEAAQDAGGGRGVVLETAHDAARLIDGIDLGQVSIFLDAGGNALPAAGLLLAAADRTGVSSDTMSGSLHCDPLGALARDGALPAGLNSNFRQMADLAAWCGAHAPRVRPIAVSTSPYHDAGATAVQELAFALATGVEYLRRLTEAGHEIDEAAARILFVFSTGRDFFMEISKLRAARLAWAAVLARCGVAAEAQRMTIHARNSARTKTARDPWVNMVRATLETFAAVSGGADSIAASPFDEALGEPEDSSSRIASNTHAILHEESHLDHVIDPAGGSYFVEHLTRELAAGAWDLFQAVEAQGGMTAAMVNGWVAQRIEEAAGARRAALARRRDPITGVSAYPNVGEQPLLRTESDGPVGAAHSSPTPQDTQSESVPPPSLDKLSTLSGTGRSALGSLTEAALNAARAGATLTEITDACRGREQCARAPKLRAIRDAAMFEALRDTGDAYRGRNGTRPQVFLVAMGPATRHEARVAFASGLFAPGGFEVLKTTYFENPTEAAAAFAASGARVAVICSTDETYPDLVPALTPKLREGGALCVVLAGRPGDREEAFRAAGVDEFIYTGCDVYETLRSILNGLGVLR